MDATVVRIKSIAPCHRARLIGGLTASHPEERSGVHGSASPIPGPVDGGP